MHKKVENMKIVSFVVLHYGDPAVTKSCISSILHLEDQERIRIVLVDNDLHKSANDRLALKKEYSAIPSVSVLSIEENGGFSFANNCGYRYAKEIQKASYIVVLNNDIEIRQKDFIARMEASYGQHACHILGPDVIRSSTGEHQNPMDTRIRTIQEAEYTIRMNRMALRFYPILYPLLYRKLQRDEKAALEKKKQNESYYRRVQKEIVPFGAFLIFTPAFTQKEELAFTPETQFYYEEYILTYRCRKAGYQIVYDPSMQVLHESGAATKKTYKSEKKRMRFLLERTAQACEVYRSVCAVTSDKQEQP